MQVAPQIIFHDIDRSEWVELYIAERLRRLEKFADGITSCRVTLSQEAASQHKGNRYSALVEVRVPPQHDLAVKKQKEIHDMPTQLPALIALPRTDVAQSALGSSCYRLQAAARRVLGTATAWQRPGRCSPADPCPLPPD